MKYNYYFSGILALVRVFLISVAFVFAKKLDGKISSMILLLIRSSFSFLLLTPLFIKQGLKVTNTNKLSLHFLRGVFGSAAMFCIYYSARQLPLALSSTIAMSLPLFVTLLSCLILRENIRQKQWALLILGYIGVTISLNPFRAGIIDSSIFVSILANIFLALSIISTKTLSKLDSASTIMFYYNLLLVLISVIFTGDIDIDITYNNMVILFLIGLISVFTQFCSIKSLSYSTPAFVAPFEYTRLVFAIPLGLIFFEEYPDIYTLTGAAIIIYSNIMLAKINNID
jgi:drug/metabolite transporter (DMT)-like permease